MTDKLEKAQKMLGNIPDEVHKMLEGVNYKGEPEQVAAIIFSLVDVLHADGRNYKDIGIMLHNIGDQLVNHCDELEGEEK